MTRRALFAAGAILALPLAACRQSDPRQASPPAPAVFVPASPAPAPAPKRPSILVGEDDPLHFTGTEPFWGGEARGTSLTYRTPENPRGTAIEIARSAGADTLVLGGTLADKPFTLAISAGRCSDGMSDRSYPFTAILKVGDERRRGCGWSDAHRFSGPANP